MSADAISTVAAVTSAISAIIAVWVAYRSVKLSDQALTAQDTHSKLSHKPIPFLALADHENYIRVKITNDGAGPLVIQKVRVSDGCNEHQDVLSWMPALPKGMYWSDFTSLLEGRAVLPNNDLILLKLEGDLSDQRFVSFRDECRQILARLDVQLDYTDIYEGIFEPYQRKMDWFGRSKGTHA